MCSRNLHKLNRFFLISFHFIMQNYRKLIVNSCFEYKIIRSPLTISDLMVVFFSRAKRR